jgi:hypothetical protein
MKVYTPDSKILSPGEMLLKSGPATKMCITGEVQGLSDVYPYTGCLTSFTKLTPDTLFFIVDSKCVFGEQDPTVWNRLVRADHIVPRWHDKFIDVRNKGRDRNVLKKLLKAWDPDYVTGGKDEPIVDVHEARRLVQHDADGGVIFTDEKWDILQESFDPNSVSIML